MIFDGRFSAGRREIVFEAIEQAEPAMVAVGGNGGGDVLRQLARLGDDERFVIDPEETRRPCVCADRDDRGQARATCRPIAWRARIPEAGCFTLPEGT